DRATLGVGAFDDGRLEDRRVADQATLHLERRNAIAARLDDVVAAPLEPAIAVGIARQHVAGVIPRAAKYLGGLRRLVPVALHHPWVAVAANAQNPVFARRNRLAG